MREFAVQHHKCGSCGFTARHMTWEFPFLPYGKYDRDRNGQPLEVAGVKIYREEGELIVEAPGEGKWALCSTSASAHLTFYWICRPFVVEADNPCDSDFMEDISS